MVMLSVFSVFPWPTTAGITCSANRRICSGKIGYFSSSPACSALTVSGDSEFRPRRAQAGLGRVRARASKSADERATKPLGRLNRDLFAIGVIRKVCLRKELK